MENSTCDDEEAEEENLDNQACDDDLFTQVKRTPRATSHYSPTYSPAYAS